ncbi:MAG TPA: hypothetical protein VLK89_09275 [Solirubrobacterales bacterium]|nr:hypothetical protein [Solirubrobacterales bacterium]
MSAVPDFCHGLLAGMKAPKGAISTYTELRFKDGDQRTHIPDGAVVVERGKKRWGCLVEIKTSGVSLEAEQISRYLDLARDNGFDGFLTISNEINSDPYALPYSVDKRKLRGLTVYHLSWWRVLTEAIVQHRFRGIEDPDQAWILGELIRYLDDGKSGASGFEGMGQEWVRVREDARNETLRASDPEAKTICHRWEQFAEYLCLHLSQEIGVDVTHQRPRGADSNDRIGTAAKRLADEGVLECSIRVPDAVGPLGVEANLRTRRVTTTVEIQAPKEGRPKTRVNWLLRQLKDAPDDLRVEVRLSRARSTQSALLRDCRDAPERLLLEGDPKREPRSFLLALSKPMGRKGGRTDGSFTAETRRQTTEFYRDLVQGLMPPQTKAPRIREDEQKTTDPDEGPAPVPKAAKETRGELDSTLLRFAEFSPFSS